MGLAMSNTYDAIVIGGGHNGLVSAAYLARSGARTLVLESRATLGGAATTESPWEDAPHLRVTRLSYVMSLMPPTIMRELELERHGYKVHPMGPYYQAFPEGGSLTIYEDDPAPNLRTAGQVVQEGRRDVAEVERVAGGHRRRDGPAAHPGAAQHRLAPSERSAGSGQAGVEPARHQRSHHRRRHPAAHDEHRRPARRLVRITANQRRARRQRRHRHMGRTVRARHRLRDGAPFHR